MIWTNIKPATSLKRRVEENKMLQGFILTVAGMGTVFLFLILLVWVMTLNARMVRVLEDKGLVSPAGRTATAPQTSDMAKVAAAIAIARKALGKG